MEGDLSGGFGAASRSIFLSTPSGWRATAACAGELATGGDFYPRPPGGGRPQSTRKVPRPQQFLSTPSGWRATRRISNPLSRTEISIHALRVEGDPRSTHRLPNANKFLSTPSGWRATPTRYRCRLVPLLFLSTPSGWRATAVDMPEMMPAIGFLSTPSGWRATGRCLRRRRSEKISIHALRVEGDWHSTQSHAVLTDFYPRPPGGGRQLETCRSTFKISNFYPRPPGGGRRMWLLGSPMTYHFYPRPPGGGRQEWPPPSVYRAAHFYPRPPGGGRLHDIVQVRFFLRISIHALRVEGDSATIPFSNVAP